MFRGIAIDVVIGAALAAVIAVLALTRLVRAIQSSRLTIYQYQSGLRFQDGRLIANLAPGTYYRLWPGTLIFVEDLREREVGLTGQEMLTADHLTVRISLSAKARITDLATMVLSTKDAFGDLHSDLQIALRKAVQARTLETMLAARDTIGPEVLAAVVAQATARGIALITVEVRDVMLSGEAKRAYADIFRARKDGEAALERARGETAALRNLANGARLLKDNPHLYQLRLLQALAAPGAKGATVVLNAGVEPLPPTAISPAPPPAGTGAGDDVVV